MPKINQYYIKPEIKKPIEEVCELKDYEVKQSKLSLTARNKITNKSGSNYISENKDNYGPCLINGQLNYDDCHCSSDELDRQLKIIRNKRELEALERERNDCQRQLDFIIKKVCLAKPMSSINNRRVFYLANLYQKNTKEKKRVEIQE
jgi:hypothetical protein